MRRPPRLLVDARKLRDWGIGTYIRGLLAGLAERGGFEVVALVRAVDAAQLPGGVRPVLSEAPHYSLGELVSVRAAISRERPDLFHAPHYVVPFLPPRATLVTIHDLMHLHRVEHAGTAKHAYARVMLGRAVRNAARILVNSEATRSELCAFAPEAAAKVRVTPLALDPRFLEPILSVPARFSEPYALFVGNDKPHKNLEGLLKAFGRTRAPVRLVLAGGPEETRGARADRIARHGLQDRCDDLGFVPDADLPALMAGAALLVLPSFAEGFGLPALEALAAGAPVVCSDLPALREATGGSALFADPSRPETFAAAIDHLLEDASVRARLVVRGREHAALFTRAKLAERTAAAYAEVLGS